MNTLDANQTSGIPDIPESMIFDIRSMIKWGRFLSIVSFILCGFMAIGVIAILAGGQQSYGALGTNSFLIAFIYILVLAFYFIPTLYLFNFTTSAKSAITYGNKEDVAKAIEKLAFLFKFLGITTLIILAIYAFFFLIGLTMIAASI